MMVDFWFKDPLQVAFTGRVKNATRPTRPVKGHFIDN